MEAILRDLLEQLQEATDAANILQQKVFVLQDENEALKLELIVCRGNEAKAGAI